MFQKPGLNVLMFYHGATASRTATVSTFDTPTDRDVDQTSMIYMDMKAYMTPLLNLIVALDLDEVQS